VNDERTFKTVEPDKTLTVRTARTGDAARELRSVVAASRGDAGVDNITLNMVIRRLARAEVKAGDVEKASATLDAMPGVFDKKGVKEQVVQVIKEQAQQEKAQLIADYAG
jgi:thioredoxin-like negative regulator of GroEL